MAEIQKKFDDLYDKLSSSRFLKKDGLGGEIPFFIFSYKAIQEITVAENIQLLKRRLDNAGIPVLDINLYDVVCDILEGKRGIDRMFRVERAKSKDKFLRALQSSLNIHEVLMPNIEKKILESDAKIYFLTGVGLVYPFLRSHTILNNLQNIAKQAPTVMFFPGEYDGHSLNLFGLLKDDNYYRAFNLDKIEIK